MTSAIYLKKNDSISLLQKFISEILIKKWKSILFECHFEKLSKLRQKFHQLLEWKKTWANDDFEDPQLFTNNKNGRFFLKLLQKTDLKKIKNTQIKYIDLPYSCDPKLLSTFLQTYKETFKIRRDIYYYHKGAFIIFRQSLLYIESKNYYLIKPIKGNGRLGKGAYGVVKKFSSKITFTENHIEITSPPEQVIKKQIICHPIKNKKGLKVSNKKSIQAEIKILQKIYGSESIEYFFIGEKAYIIMPRIRGVVPSKLINKKGDPIESILRIMKFALAAAQAVENLHKKANVLHRDIKHCNIMYEESQNRATLIDFGFSIVFDPSKKAETLENLAGTKAYMAPELLSKAAFYSYSEASDIYAFVCMLLKLLLEALGNKMDNFPKNDPNMLPTIDWCNVLAKIQTQWRTLGIAEEIINSFGALMSAVLTQSPESRPTIIIIKQQLVEIENRLNPPINEDTDRSDNAPTPATPTP